MFHKKHYFVRIGECVAVQFQALQSSEVSYFRLANQSVVYQITFLLIGRKTYSRICKSVASPCRCSWWRQSKNRAMTIKGLMLFDLNPTPTQGCEIECKECGEWSPHSEWTESEVGCEDCGSHSAIRCRKCDEDFDHVWSVNLKTRLPVEIEIPT